MQGRQGGENERSMMYERGIIMESGAEAVAVADETTVGLPVWVTTTTSTSSLRRGGRGGDGGGGRDGGGSGHDCIHVLWV